MSLTVFVFFPLVSMDKVSQLCAPPSLTQSQQFIESTKKLRKQMDKKSINDANEEIDKEYEKYLNSLPVEKRTEAYAGMVEGYQELALITRKIFQRNKKMSSLISKNSTDGLMKLYPWQLIDVLVMLQKQRKSVSVACNNAYKLKEFEKAFIFTEFQSSIDTFCAYLDPNATLSDHDRTPIIDNRDIYHDLRSVISAACTKIDDIEDDKSDAQHLSYNHPYTPKGIDDEIKKARDEIREELLARVGAKINRSSRNGVFSAVGFSVSILAMLGAKFGVIPTQTIGVKTYAVASAGFGLGTLYNCRKHWKLVDEYKRINTRFISDEEARAFITQKNK